jgi:hypothetical protein
MGCPACDENRRRLDDHERWNEDPSHCRNGHDWQANAIVNNQGRTICRLCRLDNMRRWRNRNQR